MKVRVKSPFLNKLNLKEEFNIGDEIEVSEERALNLISRGLAETIESEEDDDFEDGESEEDIVDKPKRRKKKEQNED